MLDYAELATLRKRGEWLLVMCKNCQLTSPQVFGVGLNTAVLSQLEKEKHNRKLLPKMFLMQIFVKIHTLWQSLQ